MKLLIITSVREDLDAVSRMLEQCGVTVFSVADTIGHKTDHPDYVPGNWYGGKGEGTNALFYFSFTDDEKAGTTLDLVNSYNTENKTGFPVRAFICPVEGWSN